MNVSPARQNDLTSKITADCKTLFGAYNRGAHAGVRLPTLGKPEWDGVVPILGDPSLRLVVGNQRQSFEGPTHEPSAGIKAAANRPTAET